MIHTREDRGGGSAKWKGNTCRAYSWPGDKLGGGRGVRRDGWQAGAQVDDFSEEGNRILRGWGQV